MSKTSIDIPKVDPCPFCDYLSGVRPFTILTSDLLTATLVTREQRGIGHLLIVPKAHRPTLLDLDEDEAEAIMHAVRASASAITRAYKVEGIAVWQNNGIPAHQTIPHVHFHVAGTLPEGGTEWNEVDEVPVKETDAIAQRLRQFMG